MLPLSKPGKTPVESKGLEASLAAAGVSLQELFGWQKVAFRRVEAVSASHVSLDFQARAVALPRSLFPRLEADQWVRFERQGEAVTVALDLRATLRAESRMTDLFQSLVR
ncbi:MAG: hypothetical protein JNJ54_24835 [Myxococcaceae bacterium]|nr:hypothetical protein [Myxococcaceae bacterium]